MSLAPRIRAIPIALIAVAMTCYWTGSCAEPTDEQHVSLTLRLRHDPRGLRELSRVLDEVSTPLSSGADAGPSSPLNRRARKYGEHLTAEEADALVRPAEGAAEAVLDWLSSQGIAPAGTTTLPRLARLASTTGRVPRRAVFEDTDATHAIHSSVIAGTEVGAFEASGSDRAAGAEAPLALALPGSRIQVRRGACVARGDAVHCVSPAPAVSRILGVPVSALGAHAPFEVPEGLREHVALITGLAPAWRPRNRAHVNLVGANAVTLQPGDSPSVEDQPKLGARELRERLGIPRGAQSLNPLNRIGVAGFGTSFSPSSLASQRLEEGLSDRNVSRHMNAALGSPVLPEGDLDVQVAMGVADGAETWFFEQGKGDWLLALLDNVDGQDNPPWVVSISYGWAERDQCSRGTGAAAEECGRYGYSARDYVDRANTVFQKLGVRGITVVASAGDSGAAGDADNCPLSDVRISSGAGGAGGSNGTAGGGGGDAAINRCPQVTLTRDGNTCHYPSPRCRPLLANNDCIQVLSDIGAASPACETRADPVADHPTFSSTCTCDAVFRAAAGDGSGVVQRGKCVAQRYVYDLAGGQAMQPTFPASSPYVTSVGGTSLAPGSGSLCARAGVLCPKVEVAASADTAGVTVSSGGGFAAFSQMPSYQKSVVDAYLTAHGVDVAGAQKPFSPSAPATAPSSSPAGNGSSSTTARKVTATTTTTTLVGSQSEVSVPRTEIPPPETYDFTRRAYPDIAGPAAGCLFSHGAEGTLTVAQGTSCAAPAIAGAIALMNAALFDRGRAPVGFLNPVLYAAARERPEAFIDVTQGTNHCGARGSVCCAFGWPAGPSWDPVTGLGVPVYSELLHHVLGGSKKTATVGLAEGNGAEDPYLTTPIVLGVGLLCMFIAMIPGIVFMALIKYLSKWLAALITWYEVPAPASTAKPWDNKKRRRRVRDTTLRADYVGAEGEDDGKGATFRTTASGVLIDENKRKQQQ